MKKASYEIVQSENTCGHAFKVGTVVKISRIRENGDIDAVGPNAEGKVIEQIVDKADIRKVA